MPTGIGPEGKSLCGLFPRGLPNPKTAPILEHFHLIEAHATRKDQWLSRAHEEGQACGDGPGGGVQDSPADGESWPQSGMQSAAGEPGNKIQQNRVFKCRY